MRLTVEIKTTVKGVFYVVYDDDTPMYITRDEVELKRVRHKMMRMS